MCGYLFSSVCAFEQFVVAKKGIEKQSEGGDAEALANVDEAVVLESDSHEWGIGVRLDCRTPSLSPLTFPHVYVFTEQVDLASLCSTKWSIGAHRHPGGDGSYRGCTDKCEWRFCCRPTHRSPPPTAAAHVLRPHSHALRLCLLVSPCTLSTSPPWPPAPC